MAVVIGLIRQCKEVKRIVGNMGICRKCEHFCGFYISNTFYRFFSIFFVREYVVMIWLQSQEVHGGKKCSHRNVHGSPEERGNLAQTFPYFTASFFVSWNKDGRELSLSGEVHSGHLYLYFKAPPPQGTLFRWKKSFLLLPWGRLPPEHLLIE